MKYTLDYEKYAELARRVAAEGSVLLRNEDGVLPLQKRAEGVDLRQNPVRAL